MEEGTKNSKKDLCKTIKGQKSVKKETKKKD
jgi:hypothetical protein